MTPAFLITIDTEGDNLWSRPRTVTTRNAASLPRFQSLAEKYQLQPTWLVNWEMAHDRACTVFLRDVLARAAGEVGAHLHAWDTPPLEPLTGDDARHHPFLAEYPEPLMRAKLERLTRALEDQFHQAPTSHRAGRWALDGRYARLLATLGYQTDCSVCPGVDWRSTKGAPRGCGAPDYRTAPRTPYWLDFQDVTRAASPSAGETLLEIPMTTGVESAGLGAKLRELFSQRHAWLRPNGRNRAAMQRRVDDAVAGHHPHVMFMLHSSELMAGGSPAFGDATAIERLYADVEALFAHATGCGCRGMTLNKFGRAWRRAAMATNPASLNKLCPSTIA